MSGNYNNQDGYGNSDNNNSYENNISYDEYGSYGTSGSNESCNPDGFLDAYADENSPSAGKENKGNSSPLQKAIAAVFLVWFFGSVIAMIYFSKSSAPCLVATVLGQLFLIIGIAAIISTIKNRSFQIFVLIFPVIGALCLFFSMYYHFVPEKREEIMNMIPTFAIILFFLVGLVIFLTAIINPIQLRKKCTMSILGKVVELKKRYNGGTATYSPVYEIYFRGETIRLSNDFYTNISVPKEGETYEIFINPDNPKQFYQPSQSGKVNIFLMVFGFFFMAVPALCFYMMYLHK